MASLAELRAHIDDLDHQIIQLLAERAKTVEHIGELKTSEEEIIAPERQEQVYKTRRAWARQYGLDPEFAEMLYRTMIDYFIEQQRRQLERKARE